MLLFELENIGFIDLNTILLVEVSLGLFPVPERDQFPIIRASIRVTLHIDSYLAFLHKRLGRNKNCQLVFIVVTLESQLNLLVLGVLVKGSIDLFEDCVWSTVLVNSGHTHLVVF